MYYIYIYIYSPSGESRTGEITRRRLSPSGESRALEMSWLKALALQTFAARCCEDASLDDRE